jgi:excisionase family DNA binding protein
MIATAEGLLLTTSQVAQLLRAHPSSVKRWCNEGELPFAKTEGGHRRIHLRDALQLARSRDIATFLDPFAPYEGHVWSAVADIAAGRGFYTLNSLALGWAMRGYAERVGQLYGDLLRLGQPPMHDVFDEGIRELMRLVGEAWRDGRLRVGEEHLTSQSILEALIRFRLEMPTASRNGRGVPPPRRAVVGCMEGVQHQLGAMCARLSLEREGWEVLYLGPDVPVEELAAVQRSREAELLCVSFAGVGSIGDVRRCVRILGEFYRPAQPYSLVLGGSVEDELDLPPKPFKEVVLVESSKKFVSWLSMREAS